MRVAVSARNNLKTRTSLRPVSIFGGEDHSWDNYAPSKELPNTSIGEDISDVGRLLWSGVDSAALNVREAMTKIPVVGEAVVSGIDAVDKYVFGNEDSEQFLKQDQQETIQNTTQKMQAALGKDWWDEEKGTLGPAWSPCVST